MATVRNAPAQPPRFVQTKRACGGRELDLSEAHLYIGRLQSRRTPDVRVNVMDSRGATGEAPVQSALPGDSRDWSRGAKEAQGEVERGITAIDVRFEGFCYLFDRSWCLQTLQALPPRLIRRIRRVFERGARQLHTRPGSEVYGFNIDIWATRHLH